MKHSPCFVAAISFYNPTINLNQSMNATNSHTQSLPQSDDEIRIRDYAKASALIVGACASIAIGFTLIATCYAVDDAIKRVFRKGVRHVPR